ncbi:MAG TPA: TraR/DksA C4-type zinc finger protein [Acidimicrobiales bacterium]|nr:TraR/DksA C4-type zinc finger protein [Acidimicrobiales bacterium]
MPRASKAVDAAKQPGRKVAAAGAAKSEPKAAAKPSKAAAKSGAAGKGPSSVAAPSSSKAARATKPAKAAKAPAPPGKKSGAAKAAKAEPAAKAARAEPPAKAEKAASAAKPAKRIEGAGADKFLDEQRVLLEHERISYVAQAADLKAEADQLAQEMEPGDIQFDDESGEGATAAVDRERDLALSAQARVEVDEIDHALAKLDGGSYGICEGCGQLIPRARLKALPHARLCVACKSGGLSRR